MLTINSMPSSSCKYSVLILGIGCVVLYWGVGSALFQVLWKIKKHLFYLCFSLTYLRPRPLVQDQVAAPATVPARLVLAAVCRLSGAPSL